VRGKTFTMVTETYRLLRHAEAKRVLFLVDRNNLGRQAEIEFENFRTPEDGTPFGELYNVQRLRGGLVLGSTHVVIEFAHRDGLPIGAPLTHDLGHYRHQIPGEVISNLRHQLAEIRPEHRLTDVLEECVRIREDLGYPITITPYSQYVATQAAINVASEQRYGVVIDELVRFAAGTYGTDSGYLHMNQDLRDRFLSAPAGLSAAGHHDFAG
jgi:hypothetical protein